MQKRSRSNRGHSLEVLPDIHPFEADNVSSAFKANDGCDRLGSLRAARFPCIREQRGPWDTDERITSVPALVYQDGRPYNHLALERFKEDPYKYYWNVYPWCPKRPKLFIPHRVAYKGLSKPPVRQYFKLTPKRVTSDLALPSYEVLRPDDPEALSHFFKHCV